MPVMSCIKNGKTGRKWGPNGSCYTGRDAEKKALAQGRAIEASKRRPK